MKKVLLGMSGGVDSSTSAILLKQAGYEVIGATMQLLNESNSSVCTDAKKVCDKIGIKHIVIDCKEQFKNSVICNFISCYENAKTPNPCIECNKYLKFGTFFDKAEELGCDYISTGHYAKIIWSNIYNQYVITKSNAEKKDQTYFLYSIPSKVLPHILFPLESYTNKEQIRKIAEEYELPVANKKDSQEICFIKDNNYVGFLQKNGVENFKAGNIVLQDGTILGKHNGLIYYTIGQRKGLGISYEKPLYVLKLDKNKNEVIVGSEKDLYGTELYASELNFLVANMDLSKPIQVMAKVRYRARLSKATLSIEKNQSNNNKIAKVIFDEPQRAITSGQSVVFYINDILVGGGKIV